MVKLNVCLALMLELRARKPTFLGAQSICIIQAARWQCLYYYILSKSFLLANFTRAPVTSPLATFAPWCS